MVASIALTKTIKLNNNEIIDEAASTSTTECQQCCQRAQLFFDQQIFDDQNENNNNKDLNDKLPIKMSWQIWRESSTERRFQYENRFRLVLMQVFYNNIYKVPTSYSSLFLI